MNNRCKLIIILAVGLAWTTACSSLAWGQRPTGLLGAPDRYQALQVLPTYSGEKYNEIPLRFSLRAYCPVPADQGELGSCVGWAVGYGALTISEAVRDQLTDASLITQRAHSAAFIYNQIRVKEDCNYGAFIEDALQLVKLHGDCLERTFNFNQYSCQETPPQLAVAEASAYKIQDYAALFAPEDSRSSRTAKICKVLASKTPVVVGLEVTESFWQVLPGQRAWLPGLSEPSTGYHALVAVGYDNVEKEFELLNSFGAQWGAGGFIRMKYHDFERLCRYAYVLMMSDEPTASSTGLTPTYLPDPATAPTLLKGEFVFRQPAGYLTLADGREAPYFAEVPTRYDSQAGLYETQQYAYRVGDVFQLVARGAPAGRYLYVFSRSPNGQINLHFPKIGDHSRSADFMLTGNAEIVIPGDETVLQLSEAGADFLCVLYSTVSVANIEQRLHNLQQSNLPFSEAIQTVFADLLIPAAKVRADPARMAFAAQANVAQGQVAATIVLRVIAE